MKLTLAKISALTKADVRQVKTINASNQGVTELDDISACVELTRLDVSKNQLSSLESIEYAVGLSWLDISNNNLTSLRGVERLVELTLLKAAANKIFDVYPLRSLSKLKTLVLNANKLVNTENMSYFPDLDTLVLSDNFIESVTLDHHPKLEKLSLSRNLIRVVPPLKKSFELKELRLNSNKITSLPDHLRFKSQLTLLDLGNNLITSLDSLQVLEELKNLKNLNLKGNKVTFDPSYFSHVVKLLPNLEILDNNRVSVWRSRGYTPSAPSEASDPRQLPTSRGSTPPPAPKTKAQDDGLVPAKKRKRDGLDLAEEVKQEEKPSTPSLPVQPMQAEPLRAEPKKDPKKEMDAVASPVSGVVALIPGKRREKKKALVDPLSLLADPDAGVGLGSTSSWD